MTNKTCECAAYCPVYMAFLARAEEQEEFSVLENDEYACTAQKETRMNLCIRDDSVVSAPLEVAVA